MPAATETREFQAEARELLDLVVHSLYAHREVFLRELVSNASDALDKRRVAALRDPDAWADAGEPEIRLEPDPVARTLAVVDTGIGMTADEVAQNLGTIARSGTRRFVEELRAAGESAPDLIGRFGVGFYSAFMVAGEVVLETRTVGAAGVRWTSRGEGTYTLEEADGLPLGTRVVLHLKPAAADEDDAQDFADADVLRDVVRRHSDFVEHPIRLVEDGGEPELLNSQRPLWTRPRSELDAEAYADFYRHLTGDWQPPLETVHFVAEGALEYTALLFLPRTRPPGLFDPREARSRLSLYVRRVRITDDFGELLPPWLRFVRGVVESADLPLNVSRETLQHARQVKPIGKRLVRKLLDALAALLRDRREDYEAFSAQFGAVLKEGLAAEGEHREELAKLVLLPSSAGDRPTTLDEYVARMPAEQEAIWVLAAPDLAAARRSPHLEALRARGQEVLFLVDAVDEFAFQRVAEHAGKPLRSVAKGALDVGDGAARAEREKRTAERGPLLEAVRERLAEHVGEVRFGERLVESPAALVSGEHALAPHVERALREAGQAAFLPHADRRALELNPRHPLVERLEALRASDPARFADACDLLLGSALLAEGSPLPDPARFARLVGDLLAR